MKYFIYYTKQNTPWNMTRHVFICFIYINLIFTHNVHICIKNLQFSNLHTIDNNDDVIQVITYT